MAEVQQLVDMGFEEADARRALDQVNLNVEQAIERLLNPLSVAEEPLAAQHRPAMEEAGGPGAARVCYPAPAGGDGDAAAQVPEPSATSRLTAGEEQRREGLATSAAESALKSNRVGDLPCGLRNIGNTCYVNSFLQTLVHIDGFRHRILRYRAPAELAPGSCPAPAETAVHNTVKITSAPEPEAEQSAPSPKADNASRREHCIRLALELRRLFAHSLFTLRTCIDPSQLLGELVDERGQKLQIGSQEDVGEFMLKFLERLEEGLCAGGVLDGGPTAASSSSAEVRDSIDVGATAAGDADAVQPPSPVSRGGGDEGAPPEPLPPAAPPPEARDEAVEPAAEAAPPPEEPPPPVAATAPPPPVAAAAPEEELGVACDAPPSEAAATDKAEPLPEEEEVLEVGPKEPAPPPEPPESADAEPQAGQLEERCQDAEKPVSKGDRSLLQQLFFGQQVQVFSYRESPAADKASGAPVAAASTQEGDEDVTAEPLPASTEADQAGKTDPEGFVVSEEKSDFLQIFLDVKHKDLYSAWEAANRTEVDYTTPSGSTTTARASVWVERLPKLLFFQLQRVVFDQETKAQVKLDESFEFDLTVHVDRFLLANRAAASAAATRARELRRRRARLEEALVRFTEYQGRSGLGVDEVLGWAADCVQENSDAWAGDAGADGGAGGDGDGPLLENCDPHAIVTARMPEATAALGDRWPSSTSTVRLPRNCRDACRLQESALREEVIRLNAEIGDAHRDLRQRPFELYAIWVHQGIAGSGHYWAYVRDWRGDRWIRYDDALVSVVPWEDVRKEAVGQAGSNASAYVLVYVDAELAAEQGCALELEAALRAAEAVLPQRLLSEILLDNQRHEEEKAQQEERLAEQELRQHAEAIFQHYAGLIHEWEPLKRIGDSVGNPHDHSAQKQLFDPALLNFELFLYRLHGEQEVWTRLVAQSVDAQREVRQWKPEEEGRVLFCLASTLRSQKCYASMLREKAGETRHAWQTRQCCCELVPLDMPKLSSQYNVLLIQAHIMDEALQSLKEDGSQLVSTVGAMALVWARWNLEAEDRLRHNMVLLIMSTLIYNTVTILHEHKRALSKSVLGAFQPACEYFFVLLHAVEWPNTWRSPVIAKLQNIFLPLGPVFAKQVNREIVQKETVLQHPLTQAQARWDAYETQRPQPGQEFLDRHRSLYRWLMQDEERPPAVAREYVFSHAPELRDQLSAGMTP